MSPGQIDLVQTLAFGWVICWGFILFAHPLLVFRLLGRRNPSARMLRLARIIGTVEFILVVIGAVAYVVVKFAK